MCSLAITPMDEGHYAETVDGQRRVRGPEHAETLYTLEILAIDICHEGRYGDAKQLFEEAIQTAGKADQPYKLSVAWENFADGAAIAPR
jgi:hypothetical protein